MSRMPLGLLAEHLCCSPGDTHINAARAADAASVLFDLELRGVQYAAVPIRGDDGDVVVALADRPFTVPRSVPAMVPLTRAEGTRSGRLGSDCAAGILLSIGHSEATGPERLSDGWLRIARGEAEGNTRGIYQASETGG